MKFTVYYELNGRKMKTTVKANSQAQAIELIRARLIIHKVEPILTNPLSDIFANPVNDIFPHFN